MLAPAQMPNCMSLRPSGPASNGSSTMATVPKRVTIAIPTATSSSSAPAVSSIAAMAEAPQMAKPVPISRLRAAPSFTRFPSHVVTTSVTTRVPATSATVPTPSAMIEPNDTANPSRTMPIRSSRLVTAAERLLRHRGQQAGVAGDHAQSDGPGEDADRGHELVGEHRAPEPECGRDQSRPAPGGLLLGAAAPRTTTSSSAARTAPSLWTAVMPGRAAAEWDGTRPSGPARPRSAAPR